MKIKMERVNSELAKQITKVIANDIKDPRLGDCIVGVTKVMATADLKFAKVYLSIYSKNAESQKIAFDTIVRSKSYIRNMLKDTVQIRLLPDLIFLIDDSVDYGMKIESILSKIDIPPADLTEETTNE